MSTESEKTHYAPSQRVWLRRVRIPPSRAAAFKRFGVPERRRNLRDALIIGLLLHALTTVADFKIAPDAFWSMQFLRWCVLLPLGALLAFHLHRSQRPLIFDQLLVGSFCVCAVVLITYAALMPAAPAAQGYLMGDYAVLVFAATAMTLPFPIAGSLAVFIIALLSGIWWIQPTLQSALGLPNIVAGVCIAVPTLFANWTLENERRHQFLLVTRERERGRTIADQRDILARLAALDPLTGLSNRRGFEAGLANDLEGAGGSAPIAVAMIDIDRFKEYNDQFGHMAGDLALKNVANALAEAISGFGRIARVGGEEFAIVIIGRDAPEVKMLIEACRLAVQGRNIAHPSSLPDGVVTVSIGLAVARVADISIDTLMESADQALYAVKAAGRNAVGLCEA